jgi:hypothetical protein
MYYTFWWWWVRKERLAGWSGWSEAVLGVLEFRRRRGKGVRPRGCVQIAFFFSFFGSLEACMGRSGCSGYLFPLVLCPLLFSRSPSRFFLFRTSGRLITLFVFAAFTSAFLFLALVSISLSLCPFSLSVDIRRLFVPWADLPFFFFLSDQQPSTGAYTRGAKIRPSCSMDL